MSKREKIVNIFNKNHITITRTENLQNKDCYGRIVHQQEGYHKISLPGKQMKLQSPLGFYYYKKVPQEYSTNLSEIIKLEISNGMYKYTLCYYKKDWNKNIGIEVRPWELFEDKPMSEHFIFDLKDCIDKLLDFIRFEKILIIECYSFSNNIERDLNYVKNMLYRDLFGNEKGIRFQTDSEKIISHGFDLKTSFRKM